jgi:hypothetical protein
MYVYIAFINLGLIPNTVNIKCKQMSVDVDSLIGYQLGYVPRNLAP